MAEPRFEIYKGNKGDWRFRLKANNNEIIAVGQGYSSRQACLKGIKSIKKNAETAPVFHREEGETIEEMDRIEPIQEDESVVETPVETSTVTPVESSTETSEDRTAGYIAIIALILAIVALGLAVIAI
ncbi:MAG: YegP family protein [Candidatus Hadarchaeia archaeon]